MGLLETVHYCGEEIEGCWLVLSFLVWIASIGRRKS